jgi:ATP-binding cassette subfamily F protein uup
VLDEPTNDLDLETLEVLEDLLLDYPGTLLLVSHDRAFLNNLVTSTLILDDAGHVSEFVGGYDDWQQQREQAVAAIPQPIKPAARPTAEVVIEASATTRKLSYKEQRALEAQQRELAELPHTIERLEAEQHRLSAAMAEPAFYQRDRSEIALAVQELKDLEDQLAAAYQRWTELEP